MGPRVQRDAAVTPDTAVGRPRPDSCAGNRPDRVPPERGAPSRPYNAYASSPSPALPRSFYHDRLQPDEAVGFTHASSVMPVVRSSLLAGVGHRDPVVDAVE